MTSDFKPEVVILSKTAHAQRKIAKIGEKQSRTAIDYRTPMSQLSLNPFSARYSRPEVELMYLLYAQTLSSQKSPKMVSHARNDCVFIQRAR